MEEAEQNWERTGRATRRSLTALSASLFVCVSLCNVMFNVMSVCVVSKPAKRDRGSLIMDTSA
jgi:hypothetical protein